MIALDTNVLVRFLVEDDPLQSDRAAGLVERVVEAGDRLFVSEVVMCELVWVLKGAYGFRRQQIADTLADLLRARHLVFSGNDRLWRALRAFDAGRGDFADYVILEQARGADCDAVATFDRALQKEGGFVEP